jgi:two-component system, LytTR family, sensor kinase
MRLSVKRPGWLLLGSGRRLSHHALFWTLQIGGWFGFGTMMLGYGLANGEHRRAVEGAAALMLSGFGLTSGYRWVLGRLRRTSVSAAALIAACAALVVIGPPVWFLLFKLIRRGLGAGASPQWPGPYVFWPDFHLESYLFQLFIILTWILLYFGINGWMTLMLERRRAEQAVITAQTARLAALQSQLEPHFLFNTLNGISSLIVDGRNEQASAMVARLGDLLRATLKTNRTPEIALADDLDLVRYYLDIQQIRFGDRLRFSLNIEPEVLSAAVPALLLQPLVENAVHHGILPRSSGGSLAIGARGERGRLYLVVEDDGVGMKKKDSSGMGLSNTATRLSELYGNQADLKVVANPAGGVTVSICIPWREVSERATAPRLPEEEE